jgi:hypothetical protein
LITLEASRLFITRVLSSDERHHIYFYSPHHKLHRMIDANRLSPNIVSAVHRMQLALIFFTSVWSE